MRVSLFVVGVVVTAALGLQLFSVSASSTAAQIVQADEVVRHLESSIKAPSALRAAMTPAIEHPAWYREQVSIQRAPEQRTITYTLATRGATSADLAEFAAQANATLNDPRGWAQLNLKFVQVPSGGGFTLILSEPSQVPTFSPGCSAEWSCRVGAAVIINDRRWTDATPAWNAAGGGIRDYRHMVINHEVGHWLGHGHYDCAAPNAYAPVMLQQSIDLQGCRFNPWPLPSELQAANLGLGL